MKVQNRAVIDLPFHTPYCVLVVTALCIYTFLEEALFLQQ